MLERHVHYVSQTCTHQQSLRAPKTLAFSAPSRCSGTVCTTRALGPSIVGAARSCFCVTSRTVACIVSSKVVNALDPTVETPIVTVELHITLSHDLSEVFMVARRYHRVLFDLLSDEHAEFPTQTASTQTAHAYYNPCYTCRLGYSSINHV